MSVAGKCPIDGLCPKHEFVHGHEAEELRRGIELLLVRYEAAVPRTKLVALLDRVDARDSLAFLESRPKSRRPKRPRKERS